MAISSEDRRRFERQALALAANESDDEGTAVWRDALADAEDARRATNGGAPLETWWSTKTEPELHRRARALGLLRLGR